MTDIPKVSPTARYGIGEAAKLLGIHRNTLRMKIEQGLFKYKINKHTGRKVIPGIEVIKYYNMSCV